MKSLFPLLLLCVQGLALAQASSADVEITFPDGAVYQGQVRDGKPHGWGYMVYAKGCQYEGGFNDGQREGEGLFTTPDGNRFDGHWKANLADGAGTLSFRLGGVYQGHWKQGQVDGKATVTYAGSGRREEVSAYEDIDLDTCDDAAKKRTTYALRSRDSSSLSLAGIRLAYGSTVPFEKTYAELSADQRRLVKAAYGPMAANDEPPYPSEGLKPIYTWMSKAQGRALVSGDLFLIVQVGADGKPTSVSAIGSPSPEMTKFAATVVMKTEYKPAICDGVPCAMPYPFRMKFTTE